MKRAHDLERRAMLGGHSYLRGESRTRELSEGLMSEGEPTASRSIGDIIREIRELSDAQIERIVEHQQQHHLRFGEAAVALRLASGDEVMWALSQQFHYPYARTGGLEESRELVMASDPFGAQAEAFRELRTQLMADTDAPRRAHAVVSAERGDGRSCVAANLAIAFSQLGGRTLLLDGDMRWPTQHKLFGCQGKAGLSGILANHPGTSVLQAVRGLPSLYLLTVGTPPPNPLELLQGSAFGVLIGRLLTRFDHVIVDTPAARSGADWRVAAAACGGAVTVARRNRSRMADLQRMSAGLAAVKVRSAGVVMNDF